MIDKIDLEDITGAERAAIWRYHLKKIPSEALIEELTRREAAEADEAFMRRLGFAPLR